MRLWRVGVALVRDTPNLDGTTALHGCSRRGAGPLAAQDFETALTALRRRVELSARFGGGGAAEA